MKNFCQDIHIPLFVLQLPQKTLARFGFCQTDWEGFLRTQLGVEIEDSNLTDTLIGFDDFCRTLRQARETIGKDRFLQAYVEDIRARHMGAVGLAMEAAPTIDDSLNIWLENAYMLAPMLKITPYDTDARRMYEFDLMMGLGDISHTYLELVLLSVASIIRNLSCGLVSADIRFAHERDLPESFYRDNFNFDPAFGQPECSLTFVRRELAKSNDYYAPLLYKQALRGIRELRENIDSHSKLSHRVRQYLMKAADSSRFPSLDEVASRFNMSVRTLTRHLHEEATSFRDMRSEIQIDIARRLLRKSTLPIKVIVERAGFSNSAAFSRAFHLASGLTPLEFRKGGSVDAGTSG